MKPIIGVFPSVKDDGSVWLYESYTAPLALFGALPIVIPYISDSKADVLYEIMDTCDAFLFTGGVDIHPSFYNCEVLPECGQILVKRDKFELLAFDYAMRTGKPILGICRGCQLMNVALVGTLCQDIPSTYPTAQRHTSDSVANPTIHEIDIPTESPLFQLSEAPRVKINSFHHQCTDKLGNGLKILATSTDGIPEGVYLDGERYVIGVQWHPERGYEYNPIDAALFRSFVKAAASAKND